MFDIQEVAKKELFGKATPEERAYLNDHLEAWRDWLAFYQGGTQAELAKIKQEEGDQRSSVPMEHLRAQRVAIIDNQRLAQQKSLEVKVKLRDQELKVKASNKLDSDIELRTHRIKVENFLGEMVSELKSMRRQLEYNSK